MKKAIVIVVLGLVFSSNANTDHKGWPHGKKWAYNCAKTTDCNIKIENIKEQPKLFIGKSVFNGKNSVTIEVSKRVGENIIETTNQVKNIVKT